MLKYNDYIFERLINEARIDYSDKFIDVISNVASPISAKIKSLYAKDVDINQNYIGIDINSSPDTVTFLPDDKVEKNGGTSGIKRSEVKVGRFVRALLKSAGVEFTDKEIEDFVNKFKAQIKGIQDRFEIVSGEDIRKYYHADSYYTGGGSLGSSCMRFNKCQKFLNIYTDNKDVVSMVILRPNTDKDLICGRAILWTTENGIKVMDRIYVNSYPDAELFKSYAKANNFLYKKFQDYSDTPFMNGDDELTDSDSQFYIKLDTDFDYYPYMDTFKYMLDGMLTNNYMEDYIKELNTTNGGVCETCDGDGEVGCPECDGEGYEACEYCYDGEVNCRNCDGTGEYECPVCDGEGDIECSKCDGEGCDNCDEGRIICENCTNGQIECGDCEGSGERECPECSGESRYECGLCEGSGRCGCPECG